MILKLILHMWILFNFLMMLGFKFHLLAETEVSISILPAPKCIYDCAVHRNRQHVKEYVYILQCTEVGTESLSCHDEPNWRVFVFCFVDRASLYNVFLKMKPTRCTQLLGIFISTSVHVSGNYVYGWLSGLQTGQSEKYQCRIHTVSSPDNGHIFDRNM